MTRRLLEKHAEGCKTKARVATIPACCSTQGILVTKSNVLHTPNLFRDKDTTGLDDHHAALCTRKDIIGTDAGIFFIRVTSHRAQDHLRTVGMAADGGCFVAFGAQIRWQCRKEEEHNTTCFHISTGFSEVSTQQEYVWRTRTAVRPEGRRLHMYLLSTKTSALRAQPKFHFLEQLPMCH